MGKRVYLGDGLYADFDGYQIALNANNGIYDYATVYLDPGVLKEFLVYIEMLNESEEPL